MKISIYNTFKNRLLIFILIIIIILSSTSFLSYYLSHVSNNQYRNIIHELFYYNDLLNSVNKLQKSLEDYIQKGTPDIKSNYAADVEKCKEILGITESLSKSEEMYYEIKNLKNLILTYDQSNQKIITIVDDKNDKNFYNELLKSKKYYSYVNDRIVKLNTQTIEKGNNKYEETKLIVGIYGLISIVVIGVIFVLSIFFSIRFTNRISYPVKQLTKYAKEISYGNFTVDDICLETTEEIYSLALALNKMKDNIRKMITQIKDKVLIEAKLKEKEFENLKMINALKNAELKMLQSQINPHFLFNTLNSIGRIAYLDGSTQVVKLIEAVSDMLRYNLKKIDKPESLEGEIQNLKRYIFIQETRFGDKLKFKINVTSQHLHLLIPCLTLQPLVENAVIHGLQPYDYNGNISLNVYDGEECVFVDIIDNGIGIDENKVRAILMEEDDFDTLTSTGIGIQNVISRLRVFYKTEDCFQIKSNLGEGTTVQIRLSNNFKVEVT